MFLRQGLWLSLELVQLVWLASEPWGSPCLCLPVIGSILGPAFYVGACDLNSCLYGEYFAG